MGKPLSVKGRQKRNRRITIWILLIIIVVAVVVAVTAILMKFNGNTTEPSGSSSSASDSVSQPDSSSSAPAAFAAVAESAAVDTSYFNDAVFVGDSLTVGLGNYGILPAENIYADIGLNLDTILTKECIKGSDGSMVTVLDALKLKKPSKVYIMLGSNGIAWITPENLAEKYSAFLAKVEEALPDATIYIESILPVTAAKQAGDARYSNEAIIEYNKLLFNLAEEKNLNYLDCHTAFKMTDGTLNTEYAEQDGMHLKKAGYQQLLEFFKTHTVK